MFRFPLAREARREDQFATRQAEAAAATSRLGAAATAHHAGARVSADDRSGLADRDRIRAEDVAAGLEELLHDLRREDVHHHPAVEPVGRELVEEAQQALPHLRARADLLDRLVLRARPAIEPSGSGGSAACCPAVPPLDPERARSAGSRRESVSRPKRTRMCGCGSPRRRRGDARDVLAGLRGAQRADDHQGQAARREPAVDDRDLAIRYFDSASSRAWRAVSTVPDIPVVMWTETMSAASRQQRLVDLEELADGRLRGGERALAGAQRAVELAPISDEVLASGAAILDEPQRNDSELVAGELLRREVVRGVRDNGNGHAGDTLTTAQHLLRRRPACVANDPARCGNFWVPTTSADRRTSRYRDHDAAHRRIPSMLRVTLRAALLSAPLALLAAAPRKPLNRGCTSPTCARACSAPRSASCRAPRRCRSTRRCSGSTAAPGRPTP